MGEVLGMALRELPASLEEAGRQAGKAFGDFLSGLQKGLNGQ
jgi:hypothetical protein